MKKESVLDPIRLTRFAPTQPVSESSRSPNSPTKKGGENYTLNKKRSKKGSFSGSRYSEDN